MRKYYAGINTLISRRFYVAWGMTAPLRENGIFDMMGSR